MDVRNEGRARFIFAIPLKPKAVANDWGRVVEHLECTLNSIFRSTSSEFTIVVGCHDVPEVSYLGDPRLQFVIADFEIEPEIAQGDRDKYRKMRLIGTYLKSLNLDDVYVMFLDADDLVDHNLVEYVLCDDNKSGYSIRDGYRYDAKTGSLGLLKNKFPGSCGSCFVAYITVDDFPTSVTDWDSHFSKFVRHAYREETALERGRIAVPVPFPAVTYIMNHDDSVQRVRLGGAIREIPRSELLIPENARVVLVERFGWTEVS